MQGYLAISETIAVINQLAQVPLLTLCMVGGYRLIIRFAPKVFEYWDKQLAANNLHVEATKDMAVALSRVVETGTGLETATASLLETSKGFQANIAAQLQMGETIKTLIQQNEEERRRNAEDHRMMIVLLRVSNRSLKELPCILNPEAGCPDPAEGS